MKEYKEYLEDVKLIDKNDNYFEHYFNKNELNTKKELQFDNLKDTWKNSYKNNNTNNQLELETNFKKNITVRDFKTQKD